MTRAVRTLAALELVGDNASLNLANSINSRVKPEHDYIASYPDLIAWAKRVGVLDSEAADALKSRASSDPVAAERTLTAVHALRDAVYRSFAAIAAGDHPPAADSRRILKAYGAAVARATVEPGERAADLRWPLASSLSAILDPIAYDAGRLFLDADRPTLKECPGCGWLFLDRSRNGTRRWCDMQVCGSRDKMRRYYRTRRAGRGAPKS